MFLKIGLVITALAAAGTTAYVVKDIRSVAAPRTQHAAAPTVAPPPGPAAPLPAPATPPPTVAAAHVHDLPPGSIETPAPDTEPSIPRAQLEKLGVERGPARGPANAKVTVVVFTDMRCKYCGAALGSLDQLFDEYPGKLRIVVKQMPVVEAAKLPAEAAFAADAQGKFWELHDLMLANQDDLSRDALLGYAAQLGLDLVKFRAALDDHRFAAAVTADVNAAKALEIMGTPAFVINGRKIIGNVPLANLRDAIDSALHD